MLHLVKKQFVAGRKNHESRKISLEAINFPDIFFASTFLPLKIMFSKHKSIRKEFLHFLQE